VEQDLSGTWRAIASSASTLAEASKPDFDDRAWAEVAVPGQWQRQTSLAGTSGPVVYRHRFAAPAPEPGRRRFLTFDGIFYQADVWLDGRYLGDAEGCFVPHSFEVTDLLARSDEHILTIELSCSPSGHRRRSRNLTGVFDNWDCLPKSFNPGGIWGPVRVTDSGVVRIAAMKLLCSEANDQRATLSVQADLDALSPVAVSLASTLSPAGSGGPSTAQAVREEDLAAGLNRVSWSMTVEQPHLWWPWSLGEQALYDFELVVSLPFGPEDACATSDHQRIRTGLRQLGGRGPTTTVNGERMFLKGANYGPTLATLADASPQLVRSDLEAAREAGLDLLRVYGHVARPELYDIADELGLMLWQDLPFAGTLRSARRQVLSQTRQVVGLLAHHPSLVRWLATQPPRQRSKPKRSHRGGATSLALSSAYRDATAPRSGAVAKAIRAQDPTRKIDPPDSGRIGGSTSQLYLGWYDGEMEDLPRVLRLWPAFGRLVGEFGAQSVPASVDFAEAGNWPDLDWDWMVEQRCLAKEVMDLRVPAEKHHSFASWSGATMAYQASLVRFYVETLRRLKYRPSAGFALHMLADPDAVVGFGLLDHARRPKDAWRALADACRPLLPLADWPRRCYCFGDRLSTDLHVVSDLRVPLEGASLEVRLSWPGGQRRWHFEGDLPADACVRVGRVSTTLVGDAPGPLELELVLSHPKGEVSSNFYHSRLEPPEKPS